MAYESTTVPGRRFANQAVGRRFDESRRNPVAQKEENEPESATEEQPIEQVVSEHGPAHTTHIMRHEDGTHSVQSEHEDGHKHESHGHDVHSAHHHSLKAHGAEADDEEQDEPTNKEPMPSMIAEE